MNEKELSHLSWLLAANKEQIRFILCDIKNISYEHQLSNNLLAFKKYIVMSQNLIKTAINSYSKCLTNGMINFTSINTIENLYVKRAAYQQNLALNLIFAEKNTHVYDHSASFNQIIINIKKLSTLTFQLYNAIEILKAKVQ